MASLSHFLLLGAAVTLAVACAAQSALPEEAADGSAGDDCDLSLSQLKLRVHKAKDEDTAQQPACQQSGCHARYSWRSACQCNSKCATYGNCCSDYQSFCVSAPATPSSSPATAPPIPSSQGSVSRLVEEFDAPLDLDTDPIWTWSDGGLSEGQVRFAKVAIALAIKRSTVQEQIRFENGNMKIVAEPISSSIHTQSVQPGNPNIDGNFVATMFVYKDAKFNHWREIDFEVTGDSAHSVTTNMLSADHTSAWKAGIQQTEEIYTPGNVRKDFHVHAFEWLPDKITWYIDGQKVREQHPGSLHIPDMAGKIMMNLWIFGDGAYFGGKQIHNNHYPLTSEYDWFRFYKWDGDTSYPCPGLTNSCLTADDRFMASNNPCDGISQEGGTRHSVFRSMALLMLLLLLLLLLLLCCCCC
ncbi:unnamed protein product [Polarella glacialis]|uniref:GH16 domain-containing protein n=1 Tax=Polarella glacialis TaxID=89957 RepID=A0A813LPI2_POLGL|nr:unnamed protein product [Polarella glacialis]